MATVDKTLSIDHSEWSQGNHGTGGSSTGASQVSNDDALNYRADTQVQGSPALGTATQKIGDGYSQNPQTGATIGPNTESTDRAYQVLGHGHQSSDDTRANAAVFRANSDAANPNSPNHQAGAELSNDVEASKEELAARRSDPALQHQAEMQDVSDRAEADIAKKKRL